MVIPATAWGVTLDAVRSVADALAGKVVWDATNPLEPDKAIPPFAEVLHAPSTLIAGQKPGVFVCGDDEDGRRTVLELVADIDADGVEAGRLANARYIEPLGMLLVQLAYVGGLGARIGSALIREPAGAGQTG